MQTNSYKIDFGKNLNGNTWYVVNDGVMGGLSQSQIKFEDNYIEFSGTTSLKNNGGFASMRSESVQLDLSNYTNVKMRYKTNSNRSFGLRLGLHNAYYMPNLTYKFSSTSNEWKTLEIPLTDFSVYRMGNPIQKNVDIEKVKDVIRIGIMLNDKKEEEFKLLIDYIEFIK